MYSAITGAIGALRGPKHGGANEVAFETQKRYSTADEAEADIRRRIEAEEVVIGFGHPVYTESDQRHVILKDHHHRLAPEAKPHRQSQLAEQIETVTADPTALLPHHAW